MSDNNSQPAYPGDYTEWKSGHPAGLQPVSRKGSGLTKRELIAAMVMQGFCADPSNHALFRSAEQAAENAVRVADALLAELAKDGAA